MLDGASAIRFNLSPAGRRRPEGPDEGECGIAVLACARGSRVDRRSHPLIVSLFSALLPAGEKSNKSRFIARQISPGQP